MTRKQEINAIYDRLCWMLKGACQSNVEPETFLEVFHLEELSMFICAVNDCWQLQDAGCRLMNSCNIDQWLDFEKVAELIYDGGGRCNRPMEKVKGKS